MKILYQCEICGNISESKLDIEKCELCGIPQQLVQTGDIIYFKDCEETSILYDRNVFPNNIVGDTMKKAQMLVGELCKYKVQDIKIDGHNIEYILSGINGESKTFSASNDFKNFWRYPVIHGNVLMQQILDKYN